MAESAADFYAWEMPQPPAIVWFRNDLRLADNPALRAAAERGGPVIPVFVWSPEEEGDWAPGGAARWWLHESLAALDGDLRRCRTRLVIRQGDALAELRSLIAETQASAVFWNRRYEPATIERDSRIKSALSAPGITAESHNAALLFEPWQVRTQAGKAFQVFTPFWRACMNLESPPEPTAVPTLPAPKTWPASLLLADLALEPKLHWAAGFRTAWTPGEAGGMEKLRRFLDGPVVEYASHRDRPDMEGISRLSPHLHFGEIGPRQIWHALGGRGEAYGRQLIWREFAHHLLFHFPHTAVAPLRAEFERFPWMEDPASLRAWQRGMTGYPIVDAGMRALWTTGWMHNRVRMIVASFLVKDLLISWREGARWFWDTLVDADLANNTLGWQWTAGCGADAAPYFRIFNPILQGEKFDPTGDYVRRWVPELARVPAEWIHKPWQSPAALLKNAGVVLGRDYPSPIVDHGEARQRALAALGSIRGKR